MSGEMSIVVFVISSASHKIHSNSVAIYDRRVESDIRTQDGTEIKKGRKAAFVTKW